MPLASHAPTATFEITAAATSARQILPTTGSPTTALITNLGPSVAFVLLGSSSVVAAPTTSVPVLQGTQLALTIGSATYVAVVTTYGIAAVNVTVGV